MRRVWFRFELRGQARIPDRPRLFVGNHNATGLVDTFTLLGELGSRGGAARRLVPLMHDALRSVGFGHRARAVGAVAADPRNAREALGALPTLE